MSAYKTPFTVPSDALLLAMGGAYRAVNVQNDLLEAVAIMKPIDPLPVQIGQRFPVLGQGRRLGLEPPDLRGRGCLRIDSPAAHDLTHDRIEGETVSIVDVLVSCQAPWPAPAMW